MPASPPTRRPDPDGFEELEELPDDVVIEELRSAPTHPYQSRAPFPVPEDEIVELGQEAIVGEEHGAHRPQPRTPVLQEYSSVVIADPQSAGGSVYPQGERTVVVRDRRALATAATRAAAVRAAAIHRRGQRDRVLVLSATVVVAVLGTSVLMWLSSGQRSAEAQPVAAPPPAARITIEAEQGDAEPDARATDEPPTVSVEQLPIVHSQR